MVNKADIPEDVAQHASAPSSKAILFEKYLQSGFQTSNT